VSKLGKVIVIPVREGWSCDTVLNDVKNALKLIDCDNSFYLQMAASARLLDLDAMQQPIHDMTEPQKDTDERLVQQAYGYNAALERVAKGGG
jgi:hypothetical protein